MCMYVVLKGLIHSSQSIQSDGSWGFHKFKNLTLNSFLKYTSICFLSSCSGTDPLTILLFHIQVGVCPVWWSGEVLQSLWAGTHSSLCWQRSFSSWERERLCREKVLQIGYSGDRRGQKMIDTWICQSEPLSPLICHSPKTGLPRTISVKLRASLNQLRDLFNKQFTDNVTHNTHEFHMGFNYLKKSIKEEESKCWSQLLELSTPSFSLWFM